MNGLFQAVTDGSDTAAYLSPSLSDDAKSAIVSSIPSGATVTISAMDQNMTTSTAKVTAQLSKGATIVYQVEFDRSSNHIGWTVKSLSADFGTAGTAARLRERRPSLLMTLMRWILRRANLAMLLPTRIRVLRIVLQNSLPIPTPKLLLRPIPHSNV